MNLPKNKVFCDTSFFFASLCPDDSNFEKAGELLEYCNSKTVAFYTTWDIVSETVTLLRYRADYKTAVEFLDKVKPTLNIIHYDDSVRTTAAEVFKKLSKDKRLFFVMLFLMLLLPICLIIFHASPLTKTSEASD